MKYLYKVMSIIFFIAGACCVSFGVWKGLDTGNYFWFLLYPGSLAFVIPAAVCVHKLQKYGVDARSFREVFFKWK